MAATGVTLEDSTVDAAATGEGSTRCWATQGHGIVLQSTVELYVLAS